MKFYLKKVFRIDLEYPYPEKANGKLRQIKLEQISLTLMGNHCEHRKKITLYHPQFFPFALVHHPQNNYGLVFQIVR